MQDAYSDAPVRKSGSGKFVLLGSLLAFLLGAGGVGWLAWQGGYDFGLGLRSRQAPATQPASPLPVLTAPGAAVAAPAITGALDTRIADLEARLTRLDMQAEAASGNAARAEGLLIALAARRAIERGTPLGYLEDQLKLRFADAQPHAVTTIITAARAPVTLDQLIGQLDELAPALAARPVNESAWQQMQRELAGLFVLRKAEAPSAAPQSRLDRARLLLRIGRVDEALAEVALMPGAKAADAWSDAARRYAGSQKALDLIETTALIEPRELKDSAGARVEQPSPVTLPTAAPAI